jgi:hypothetical protein
LLSMDWRLEVRTIHRSGDLYLFTRLRGLNSTRNADSRSASFMTRKLVKENLCY